MIDSHHHFWNYRAEEFGWVTDDMAVLRQDFLPQHLEHAIAGTGVDGVITVQAKQSLEETEWLLGLAAHNPLIKGVVGWVPLKDPSMGAVLDRFSSNAHFLGVREILQGAPDKQFFECPHFYSGNSPAGPPMPCAASAANAPGSSAPSGIKPNFASNVSLLCKTQ